MRVRSKSDRANGRRNVFSRLGEKSEAGIRVEYVRSTSSHGGCWTVDQMSRRRHRTSSISERRDLLLPRLLSLLQKPENPYATSAKASSIAVGTKTDDVTDDTDDWTRIPARNGVTLASRFKVPIIYRRVIISTAWLNSRFNTQFNFRAKGDTRKRIPQLKRPRKRFLNANRETGRSINFGIFTAKGKSSWRNPGACTRGEGTSVSFALTSVTRTHCGLYRRPRDSVTRVRSSRCRDHGGRNRTEKGTKSGACIDGIVNGKLSPATLFHCLEGNRCVLVGEISSMKER